MIRIFAVAILFWMSLAISAQAQSPVSVIGPITPGDCAQFNSTTIIKDAGLACGGSASNPEDIVLTWKAFCDGGSHPLSGQFSTLAAAQVVYPGAVSLSDETDWAAAASAVLATKNIRLLGGYSCIFNKQLVVSGYRFALIGDGQETSKITWEVGATSCGIQYNHNAILQGMTIEGISLVNSQDATSGPFNCTAIQYVTNVNNTADGWSLPRFTMRDVNMRGLLPNSGGGAPTTGWQYGLSANRPFAFYIDNVGFSGAVGTGANLRTALLAGSQAAFNFTAPDITVVACCVTINNSIVTWANIGVYAEQNIEAVRLNKVDMVNINTGFFINGSSAYQGPSEFVLRDSNINALVYAVRFINVTDSVIANNLIFQGALADISTAGINLLNAALTQVIGNSFLKLGTPTFTLISVSTSGGFNSDQTIIAQNISQSGDVGIFLDISAPNVSVLDNNQLVGVTTLYSGTFTNAEGVQAAYTPTFFSTGGTITTATPSGSYVRRNHVLALTAAINISNVGTGTGNLVVSLPSGFTAAQTMAVSGIDSSTGAPLACEILVTQTGITCTPAVALTNHLYVLSGTIPY